MNFIYFGYIPVMRPATSQAMARQYVGGIVRALPVGTRLPTIRHLATDSGVSVGAMWRAIGQLRREGILNARPRDGVRVVGGEPLPRGSATHAERSQRGPKWQRVRDAIEADLAAGAFSVRGTLPPLKRLRSTYGACYATIRKAIDNLSGARAIVATPGGYRVAPPPHMRPSATIVLIAWVAGDVLLSVFEREAMEAGVRLRILPLFPWDELLATLDRLCATRERDAFTGLALCLVGGFPQQYREILSRALPLGKPIAVLDQTGGATNTGLPANRLLRVFTAADFELPGHRVGTFLRDQGHTRIAYISPVHETKWSRGRLLGLRAAYPKRSHRDAVRVFTSHHRLAANMTREAFTEELSALTETLMRSAAQRRRLIGEALQRVSADVPYEAEWMAIARVQRTLMERALADRDITAWVMCNDRAAFIAQQFLAEMGVAVPARLSVVGFDDMPRAYGAGLTSYNFNETAAVRACIRHVLAATGRASTGANAPVRIEGYISQRATTAPVRTTVQP